MWSYDGINWTPQPSADDSKEWVDITYGDDKFVSVAETGSNNERVMYQEYVGPPNQELLLVNRSNASYKCKVEDVEDKILDDDLLLVNRSGASYKVTGADFKSKCLTTHPAVSLSALGLVYATKKITDNVDYSASGGMVVIAILWWLCREMALVVLPNLVNGTTPIHLYLMHGRIQATVFKHLMLMVIH